MSKYLWNTIKKSFEAAVKGPDVNFEAGWKVSWDESTISCTAPNGNTESIGWTDLKFVTLRTTDEGPFLADVFWHLQGDKSECIIPQGATGEEKLIEQLQKLPGFDNEAVIEAMSSTSNKTFVCWKAAID